MPLLLTTPFNPGDADPNGPYTEVKVVQNTERLDVPYLEFFVEYGNTVAGDWVPSSLNGAPKRESFTLMDTPDTLDASGNPIANTGSTDYTDFASVTAASAGDNCRQLLGAHLYSWLLNSGKFTGTIV